MSDLLIVHLIKRLDDAYFIPSQKAYISIEVWAKVLNISLPKVTNFNNFSQVGQNKEESSQFIGIENFKSLNELDQGVWSDTKNVMWARISIRQEWKNGKCVGNAQKMTWENSKNACKILRLSGFDNWRLPTIDELQTLVIKSKAGYYCPKEILLNPNQNEWGWYWSNSSVINNQRDVWFVGFDYGDLR